MAPVFRPECVTIFLNVYEGQECHSMMEQRQILEKLLSDLGLPPHYKWASADAGNFFVEWQTSENAQDAFDKMVELGMSTDVTAFHEGFVPQQLAQQDRFVTFPSTFFEVEGADNLPLSALQIWNKLKGAPGITPNITFIIDSAVPPFVHLLMPSSNSAIELVSRLEELTPCQLYRDILRKRVDAIIQNSNFVGFMGSIPSTSTASSSSRSSPSSVSTLWGSSQIPLTTRVNAGPQSHVLHPEYEGMLQTTLFELEVNPGARLFTYDIKMKYENGYPQPAKDKEMHALLDALIDGGIAEPRHLHTKKSILCSSIPLPLSDEHPRPVTMRDGRTVMMRSSSSSVINLDPCHIAETDDVNQLQECESAMNDIFQNQVGQLFYRLGGCFLRHVRSTSAEEPGRKDLKPVKIADGFNIYEALHCEVVMKRVIGIPKWTVNLNPARRVFKTQSIDSQICECIARGETVEALIQSLRGKEIITWYNPQLYILVDVNLNKRASDYLNNPPNHTGASYLAEKYRYQSVKRDSYMVIARQVRGHSNQELELVASECLLTVNPVGSRNSKLPQYCQIANPQRMRECLGIQSQLLDFAKNHDHLMNQLFKLGEQISVPFYKVDEPYIDICGCRPQLASKNWGKETGFIKYENVDIKCLYCVYDGPRDEQFLTQAVVPEVRRKFLNAKCAMNAKTIHPLSLEQFLDEGLVLDPDACVLHLISYYASGNYQRGKAKCDAFGVSAQSVDKEKLGSKLNSTSQYGAYISNLMKQLLVKRGFLPWTIQLDARRFNALNTLIIIGIDAYHAKKRFSHGVDDSGPSIIALVAYLMVRKNGALHWTHTCDFDFLPENRKEFLRQEDEILQTFCASLKSKWSSELQNGLDGVIVYRDGVGRNQFGAVAQEELPQVEEVFPGKVSYIVVQKRITFACGLIGTGFAAQNNGGDAPQGALIDQLSDVTSYQSYSTYYSHPVGEHSPVQHIILKNSLSLDDVALRVLNYHMCFMYSTYAGATKAPFTIQCAHKLSNYIADRMKEVQNGAEETISNYGRHQNGYRRSEPKLPFVADKDKLFYM